MGSMKELLFEMQEERRDEWIAENYPDAEEGTPEWDAAAQEYSWFQDWMEEAAEQQYFEASLASIPDRLQDAKAELDELESLMQFNQPRIVERMAYVHCVSVLDSFLMYSARALLSHPPHLQKFLHEADSLVPNKEDRRKLLASKWVEQEPDKDTPEKVYTWRAQSLVAKKTFQSHKVIGLVVGQHHANRQRGKQRRQPGAFTLHFTQMGFVQLLQRLQFSHHEVWRFQAQHQGAVRFQRLTDLGQLHLVHG